MKTRHWLILIFLFIFAGIPGMLHLAWILTNPRELTILTVNKSGLAPRPNHLMAYHWVFNHRKYTGRQGMIYQPVSNQLGFRSLEDGNFSINDLEGLSGQQIFDLARETDLIYYTDNYGVYSTEWYQNVQEEVPFYKIYGGLVREDLEFIRAMLRQQKVVIAEHNFLNPPTEESTRRQAQSLLHLQWQGWTGRFLPTLDSNDTQYLPSWMVELHREQNPEGWNFSRQGIAMIHEDNTLLILEYPTHLKEPAPFIITEEAPRNRFSLPKQVPYPGWFEVTHSTIEQSNIISWFELPVNAEGQKLLRKHNIPARFPAVIQNPPPGHFFYFAGDFSKAQVPERFMHFKGARYIELFLTDLLDPANRKGFFFSYYLPLTTGICREACERKEQAALSQDQFFQIKY